MNGIFLIAAGGALGAVFRHLVGETTRKAYGSAFPYGTMTVNILGSLLMGLLIGWLLAKQGSDHLKLFLATGFLGGFTTFSAFSLDAINLLESKSYSAFGLYIFGSVIFAIMALWIGLMIARKIFA